MREDEWLQWADRELRLPVFPMVPIAINDSVTSMQAHQTPPTSGSCSVSLSPMPALLSLSAPCHQAPSLAVPYPQLGHGGGWWLASGCWHSGQRRAAAARLTIRSHSS